ncbi:MAG: rubrerythrin family protein [Methanomicrobiales archaeon]|nr:rubrerythrin family protein [Methanomicrobiales archaeon]MDD1670007.1 rubrerythrin family protein [Methanomicrobiales archaeon]
MTTRDNLMAAFAGESQANRKYAGFSEEAQEKGFGNIAKLFRAASEAEATHARRLLRVMGAIGATEENLKKSVEGETHEFTAMYPGFIATAKAEGGQTEADIAFTYAMKAEEVHAGHYQKALEAVQGKRDLSAAKIFLCPICGNIFLDVVPDQCPICKAFKKKFREVQ